MISGEHSLDEIQEIRELVNKGEYALATQKTSDTMLNVQSQAFLSYGHLYIDIPWRKSETEHYRRELDMGNGIVRTEFKIDDNEFTKEYFTSLADDVLVINLKS